MYAVSPAIAAKSALPSLLYVLYHALRSITQSKTIEKCIVLKHDDLKLENIDVEILCIFGIEISIVKWYDSM